MTEEKIVELLLNRNEEGMKELLVHYAPLIRYIIAPILSNEQDREDCFSEVTMKIWANIESFDNSKGSFNGWVTSIIRNNAINYRRNNLKHTNNEEMDDNELVTDCNLEELVIKNELRSTIEKAINELSMKEQIIFYRKYYYLQSTAQIASEMCMTERAVEGKLYRIKKKLRVIIGGELNE